MSTTSEQSAPSRSRFAVFTVVAAAVAATASFLVTLGGLPVWALFVGWVAWLLRPASVGQGLRSLACLGAGLLLAIGAQASIRLLAPEIGPGAIAVTVFLVGLIVVGLRHTPVLDNPPAWFLGLLSSFALHAADPITGLVTLVPAMAVGALAAFVVQRAHHAVGG